MAPLVTRAATDLLAAMEAGEITAVEVTRAHLERISATDDRVNAFVRTLDEAALTHAADVDRRREAGEPVGSLAGLPLALKDLLCTKGVETTCSSRILEHYRPPYDATVVRKLREADAIVVGKTNMDEFAMGSSTENSAFGPTRNPWNLGRVPGGSSGGSSAALAALHAPLAIGTDTGGSVRQPAALCGLVGLKPTYGTVSRYGLIAFASSIELAGPMARTVRDAALLHTAIAGHDPCDATSAPGAVPDVLSGLEEGIEGLRIGVVREFSGEGLADGVRTGVSDAVDRLGGLGAKVTEISLPHASYGLPAYYLIAPSEASSNLSRFDGVRYGLRRDGETTEQMMARTRGEGFGPEVKRRIMIGTYALSAGYYDAYYAQAQRVRTLIMRDFDAAFAEVDVLAGPTSPTTAFGLGEKADDPLAMYLNDVYSVPASLAGVPAISVPCGLDEQGLPVGLQLIGPSLGEATLLRAARALEADLGFDPLPRGEGALELPDNGDGGNP